MDECAVTQNATLIIKRTLVRARAVFPTEPYSTESESQQQNQTYGIPPWDLLVGLSESELSHTTLPLPDNQNSLFWLEWGTLLNELDTRISHGSPN